MTKMYNRCPYCGTDNTAQRRRCSSCGRLIVKLDDSDDAAETIPSSDTAGFSGILAEVLGFPWIPATRSADPSEYLMLGASGTLPRVVGLVITNAIGVIIGLFVLIGGNPYIDFADDLAHLPFDFAWVLLMLISFLVQTTAHFACFRLLSGKGNLIAHAYLSALATTNTNLLYWIAIIVASVFRMEAVYLIILVIGGLYLLVPTVVSLREVHRFSNARAVVAFALSVVVTVPLLILYLYLFDVLRRGYPYEIYDWRLSLHLGSMLLASFLIVVYMLRERKLAGEYPLGVPVWECIKAALGQRWLQITLAFSLVCLITFCAFDLRYPALYTELPAYSATFLPKGNPDILYVYTKTTREERDDALSAIEAWNVSQREKVYAVTTPYGYLLRPNRDGMTLVITHHWDPNSVFDPDLQQVTGETGYLGGNDPYNPTGIYGLRGKYHEGYRSLVAGEVSIDYRATRGYVQAVAIHPNGEYIFVVGDNFIDTLRVDTLELVVTMRLGGQLKDLAVSPDGQTLYITDALWKRVLVVPSPIN